MTKAMRIHLRPGERLYVNGAVLRVDRKVSIEFLNNVTFLLENHVMLAEEATTPLRQLYFIVQTMLIDPSSSASTQELYEKSHALLLATFTNEQVLAGLHSVHALVHGKRLFDALKLIRTLFPIEDWVLSKPGLVATADAGPNREVA
jgi:flagellar protein FlbT